MSYRNLCNAMITIKNGYMAKLPNVKVVKSKFTYNVLQVLKQERFINNFFISDDKKYIKVDLNYQKNPDSLNYVPVISEIKFYSKPGLQVYGKAPVEMDCRVVIISTNQGIFAAHKAPKINGKRIGGNIIMGVR